MSVISALLNQTPHPASPHPALQPNPPRPAQIHCLLRTRHTSPFVHFSHIVDRKRNDRPRTAVSVSYWGCMWPGLWEADTLSYRHAVTQGSLGSRLVTHESTGPCTEHWLWIQVRKTLCIFRIPNVPGDVGRHASSPASRPSPWPGLAWPSDWRDEGRGGKAESGW